ncbi:hypothetical protein HAX54_032486, partial [Datura stramonium]|nr:hypothetical protein [Datura stramonium]
RDRADGWSSAVTDWENNHRIHCREFLTAKAGLLQQKCDSCSGRLESKIGFKICAFGSSKEGKGSNRVTFVRILSVEHPGKQCGLSSSCSRGASGLAYEWEQSDYGDVAEAFADV